MTNEVELTVEGAAAFLSQKLDAYEWFYDLKAEDTYNIPVITVYVNYMNREVMAAIPEYVGRFHVKVAYTGYLLCGEKYGVGSSYVKNRSTSSEDSDDWN